ncbi:MAG: hypothetical protein K940chlam5_00538 [Candidatus Anoxychlamydiales bacterium]|nr:hypothetical protein [Candidatus Anoxychlamydiales bacterium]
MKIQPTGVYASQPELTSKERKNLKGSIASLSRMGLSASKQQISALAESIISRREDGSSGGMSGGMGGNLGGGNA